MAAGLSSCSTAAVPDETIPRQYADMPLFLSPIMQSHAHPLSAHVTGITVPHHLLARDIIADTVALAAGNSYDRIILLSPDHFFQGKTGMSVSYQAFDTVFGTLPADPDVFNALRHLPDVDTGTFFYSEHGINAVTPFLKSNFKQARFTAITFKGTSTREDLRRVADAIEPLLTDKTLVVQSTDFSHYLSQPDAAAHDQETLFAIASGDIDRILSLNQPSHMDSLQAQWMQMTLQKEVFHASPTVVQNRNSQEYADAAVAETTSYVAQVYSPEALSVDGTDTYVFAGDTMVGRSLKEFARDPVKQDAFVKHILSLTGGAPMIVNLEGVMMDECFRMDSPWPICMETQDTLPLLKKLHVIAVGVANNHAMDFGKTAYDSMIGVLEQNGIRVLRRNQSLDFKSFRLFGFTDIDNSPEPKSGLLYEKDIDASVREAGPTARPSFAFVHWGNEYETDMDRRQDALAGLFRGEGISMVIGSHSHRAAPMDCDGSGCVVPSLGNFLFDQSGEKVSGQLLKVTFFKQGTYVPQTVSL